MKYTFIDTEGSVNVSSGLKTVGLVVTDEAFNVVEKREVYIDLDYDGTKREGSDIKYENRFNQMYCILRDYLTAPDSVVIGFDVLADVKNINAACERNKTHSLTFDFFDVQQLYMRVVPNGRKQSLAACVKALGIREFFRFHTSKADAYATARVLQKLCERANATVAQLMEKYPDITGHAEGYMAQYNVPSVGHTYANSVLNAFKIRMDFPLLYFTKKIGVVRSDGRREGVSIYYDVVLDRLFWDRHPHRGVGKAKEDSLVFGEFEALCARGEEKLKEEQPDFYAADAPLIKEKFVVSYECVACINGDTLTLLHGNKYLKSVSDENWYVKALFKKGVDPEATIRRFYTADSFERNLRRNTKWNYGDRDKAVTVNTTPFDAVQLQEGDALYLPRVYASVLTNEFGDSEIVACDKTHFGFAKAKQIVDIDALSLPDKAVRLIAQDVNGNVFGYIPTVRKIKFPMFDCVYELPLLIQRKLPNGFLKANGDKA